MTPASLTVKVVQNRAGGHTIEALPFMKVAPNERVFTNERGFTNSAKAQNPPMKKATGPQDKPSQRTSELAWPEMNGVDAVPAASLRAHRATGYSPRALGEKLPNAPPRFCIKCQISQPPLEPAYTYEGFIAPSNSNLSASHSTFLLEEERRGEEYFLSPFLIHLSFYLASQISCFFS
ncbi:hypothetical protein ACLOJK_007893 [Asimina triloba]